MRGPSVRRRVHVELVADSGGLLSYEDWGRATAVLSELIEHEGYIYADISQPEAQGACVWHILNGDVFGLRADHAEAVLFYFDSLLPTSWTRDRVDELMDAPALLDEEN